MIPERWRTGRRVPINVYAGDRAVCQCHNFTDARLIVNAVNKMLGLQAQEEAPEDKKAVDPKNWGGAA